VPAEFRYCPVCASQLSREPRDGRQLQCCPAPGCGHVFWNNPVPVVTAIVEHEGELLLARNAQWPEDVFTVIAGFLEPEEEPADAVLREVKEELDLDGEVVEFLGMHSFAVMNQLILTYHVRASGPVTLNEELAEYIRVPFSEGFYWPVSTGLVLRDFLRARGHEPECRPLPAAMRAHVEAQAGRSLND
jgi:NADH pyrophosphatase NudC (nudix superfamily)